VEGEVVVRVVIDGSGAVRSTELVQGLHEDLDRGALETAKRLRFSPAEVDGKPAVVAIDYHFVFRARPAPTAESSPAAGGETDESGEAGRSDEAGATGEPEEDDEPETAPVAEADLPAAAETIVSVRRGAVDVDRVPLLPSAEPVTGRWELTRRDLELSTGSMGDVAKVVGQLPGVAADPDMFALFYVHGGDARETAFYLDGVQLLNPNHLGGTFTVFNPKLVDTVSLYAAAPPAPYADGLAGALDVGYVDGARDDWDGIVDLNIAMGSAHVAGPLGRRGSKLRFLLSARRSWFEPYIAVMKAAGLFGDTRIRMAFGEYIGRVTAEPRGPDGAHRFRFTLLHAHDLLSIAGDPGSDALIRIDRGIETRNRVSLLALDWSWRLSPRLRWNNLGFYTHDWEDRLQEASFDVSREVITARPGWRSALELRLGRLPELRWQDPPTPGFPTGPGGPRSLQDHRLRLGLDLSVLSFGGDGRVKDPRAVPTWVALPWADLGAGPLSFDASRAWTELAVWAEDEWQQAFGIPLNLRGGLRATLLGPTREVLLSPRAGFAIPLPTATTLKGSLGLLHQPPRDPLVYDPEVGGGEAIRAARAFHISAGIEQGFPFGALLRFEAWQKWLDRLLVNPDSADAVARGLGYASIGTGTASGLDFFFGMRRGRVGLGAIGSLSRSRRSNPLNEAGPQTFAPSWEQPASLRLFGELRVGKWKRWTFGAMWELRAGRPRTPVAPQLNADGRTFRVLPYAYDSRTYGLWNELSIRIEHVVPRKDGSRVVIYLDLLNATMSRSQFVWIYGAGTVDDDGVPQPPQPYVFRQLPIRPWIGARTEF
jgi:TonB family protein